MKKVILTTLISSVISVSAFAAPTNQGHGKVKFKGEIVDAPCSISADSIDQTVDLGKIANSVLAKGGASSPKPFTIELEDCVFDSGTKAPNNKVKITFSGAGAKFDPTLLGVTGLVLEGSAASAKDNVGIQIIDTNGMPIEMGKSTTQDHQLQNGSNTLEYSAYVRGANVEVAEIPLGKFEGVTNFTLSYN